MTNFLKGIIVGIGGIIPGLSGSVLLVIFGLYQKTINAIGTLFKNFKQNLLFLIPLFAGFGLGILIFSKIIDFLLNNFEMQTRFTFLGLIIGTIPLFFREVKKEGFNKKYFIVIAIAFMAGLFVFFFNSSLFPTITEPTVIQSVLMGVTVACASTIPGLDSAATLSALGLYELYVSSIANLNFAVLIPAAFGLGTAVLILSYIMNKLIKNFYTMTFSVIFGLFLSIIPNILNESCVLAFNMSSIISIILIFIGMAISLYFGDIQGNNARIKGFIKKIKRIPDGNSEIKDTK